MFFKYYNSNIYFIIFILEFQIVSNIINKIDNDVNIASEEAANEINKFNNKLENSCKYFLVINPTVNILNNYNKLISVFELVKIIFIDLIFLYLFVLIGKKYYLKNILNNNNIYFKKINNDKIEKNQKN